MEEYRNQRSKIKCTSCSHVISISEVVMMIEDDRGGAIIKCDECGNIMAVPIKNPDESRYGFKGARTLDTWIEGYADMILQKYGLTPADVITSGGIIYELPEEQPPVEWPGTATPLYATEFINLEQTAYEELQRLKKEINKHFDTYMNGWYVKRHSCERTFVVIDYQVEGISQRAIFSKNIDHERQLNADYLLLVHHTGSDLEDVVDGIYSKTACLTYLKKLLLRWKQLANSVLIVVPFVGYPYKGSDVKNLELWDFLNSHTDAEKTKMLTRSGTHKLFQKAAETGDIPYEVLEEWGFLTNLQAALSEPSNTFLERSHSKFYAGIFDGKAEVMSGSFNIHTGPSLENIGFKNYSRDKFKSRYLDQVGPLFSYPAEEPIAAHYMVFEDGKFITEDVCQLTEFTAKYLI